MPLWLQEATNMSVRAYNASFMSEMERIWVKRDVQMHAGALISSC